MAKQNTTFPVRIDANTVIFVKDKSQAEAAKRKYFENKKFKEDNWPKLFGNPEKWAKESGLLEQE